MRVSVIPPFAPVCTFPRPFSGANMFGRGGGTVPGFGEQAATLQRSPVLTVAALVAAKSLSCNGKTATATLQRQKPLARMEMHCLCVSILSSHARASHTPLQRCREINKEWNQRLSRNAGRNGKQRRPLQFAQVSDPVEQICNTPEKVGF